MSVPPGVSTVDVCLRYNEVSKKSQLQLDVKVKTHPMIVPTLVAHKTYVHNYPTILSSPAHR